MDDWDPFADPAEASTSLLESFPLPRSSEGRALATPARNATSSLSTWNPYADIEDVAAQNAKAAAEKRQLEQQAIRQGMQAATATRTAGSVKHAVAVKSASTTAAPQSHPSRIASTRAPLETGSRLERNSNHAADNVTPSQSAVPSTRKGAFSKAACGFDKSSSSPVVPASARPGRFSAVVERGSASSMIQPKHPSSANPTYQTASSTRFPTETSAEDSDAELEAAAASGNIERLQFLLSRRAEKLEKSCNTVKPKSAPERRPSAVDKAEATIKRKEQKPQIAQKIEAPSQLEEECVMQSDLNEVPSLADILEKIHQAEKEEAEHARGRADFLALGSCAREDVEFRPEGSQRALAQIIKAQADSSLDARELLAPKPEFQHPQELQRRRLIPKKLNDDISTQSRRRQRDFKIYDLSVVT